MLEAHGGRVFRIRQNIVVVATEDFVDPVIILCVSTLVLAQLCEKINLETFQANDLAIVEFLGEPFHLLFSVKRVYIIRCFQAN